MTISLHTLKKSKGRKRAGKRLGRGLGSAKGKTGGRGQKGQKSRSGASGFQRRGLKRLLLSTPKLRGFTSQSEKASGINVGSLDSLYAKDEVVNLSTLKKKGIVCPSCAKVKILAKGDLTHALIIQGCSVSKSAEEKIIKAGGNVK